MARKPKPKPTLTDHNDPEAKAQIAEHTRNIIAFEVQRDSINAKMNAERKSIKALNVDMVAWAASKRRAAMDPDVRAEFDRSQVLCSAALGVPMQADLFADDDDDDGEGDTAGAGKIPMFN